MACAANKQAKYTITNENTADGGAFEKRRNWGGTFWEDVFQSFGMGNWQRINEKYTPHHKPTYGWE